MHVNREDLDKCTLSLFCCFKKANMPNYDYLDICLNFVCHERNIIRKSDNLHHFFMSLWDSVPLAMYPSWNERLQKICTCQVWSLSLSALSWQPWNQRAACSAVEKKRQLYLVILNAYEMNTCGKIWTVFYDYSVYIKSKTTIYTSYTLFLVSVYSEEVSELYSLLQRLHRLHVVDMAVSIQRPTTQIQARALNKYFQSTQNSAKWYFDVFQWTAWVETPGVIPPF